MFKAFLSFTLQIEISVSAFVFVPLQERHHQTQKERELGHTPDREPCLSTCVSA